MKPTETIFSNLFSLLKQTQQLTNGIPNGNPAFVTTGRVCPAVADASQATQPSLYIMEGEQDVMETAIALAKYELHCAAIVFFTNTGGDAGIPAQQLNALRDAVIYQMQQRTLDADGVTVIPLLAGLKQHLGNVVYHARVKGRILANEGLQNNQGAIVFPISILSGM